MGVASKQVEALAPAEPQGKVQPVGLLTVPLFHCTASHSAFMLSILPGRKLIIMYKWDVEEAMRLIELEKVSWMTGVPTMSAELQRAAQTTTRDLSTLAEVYAGGAARPADQVEKLAGTFKKTAPGLGYGLTETNALGAFNSGVLYLANPSSTGRAVPAVTEFKIIDSNGNHLGPEEIGEVCMKSPANAVGYWNKPEATAAAFVDGWFHTGDLGKLDENGFLSIVDRIKDIIIRGGENISCIEVEAGICSHPQVLEAAVFGVPDERLGEAVGAVVVVSGELKEPLQSLQAYLKDHLAAFKIPAYVWVHEGSLPRTATGKIFKRELKLHYNATLSAA
jgi:acyl-CoA synthetase (AMP-forming)/AMP-acid ligase II